MFPKVKLEHVSVLMEPFTLEAEVRLHRTSSLRGKAERLQEYIMRDGLKPKYTL